MRSVQLAADRAVMLVCDHLLATAPGSRVHDVQQDPRFQHRGVDLLWERGEEVLGVEVKGDRQGRRGTFFFELISNLEKDTPGCFLYSEAHLLAYVLLAEQELHLLPLPATRAWFLPRAKGYPLKHTRTSLGEKGYTTVGAVVPIREVHAQVEGAARIALSPKPLR
jgi:hypothetical protein